MTADPKPARPSRYWLITSPRTASNMLIKMLNLDAQGVRPASNGGYFFMPCTPTRYRTHIKPMNTWTGEERAAVDNVQQKSFDAFQDHIEAAEKEGQLLFVKEHVLMMTDPYFEAQVGHGDDSVIGEPGTLATRGVENPTRSPLNLTSMPDEFLQTWNPTFLIRHPAMMLPSLYRTCVGFEVDGFRRPDDRPMPMEVTMRWVRSLYEFYVDHFGKDSQWPLVLDADDVMTHPELVAKYAKLAGLDPDKLTFTWEKASEDKLKDLSTIQKTMLSSINASSKVDTSKVAGNIDIDKEAEKWRSEFGEEGGRMLERWVRDAIPDYKYLHSKRLSPE